MSPAPPGGALRVGAFGLGSGVRDPKFRHLFEAIMAEKKVDPATGEAYTLKAPVGTVSCKP